MRTSIYDKASNLYNEGQFKKSYRKFKDGHLKNDFYCSLGMLKCLLLGHGVTENKEAVISSIKQYEIELINRYERKEIEATYYLAFFLDKKIIVNDNYDVLSLVKNLARKKHKIALLFLGNCYCYGKYIDKDVDKAKIYYKKSLENGCLIAAANLGNIYYLDSQYKKAFSCYSLLKNSEIIDALEGLSKCYSHGYGIQKNLELALYYSKKIKTVNPKLYWRILTKYNYLKNDKDAFLNSVKQLKKYDEQEAYNFLVNYYSDKDRKKHEFYLQRLCKSTIKEIEIIKSGIQKANLDLEELLSIEIDFFSSSVSILGLYKYKINEEFYLYFKETYTDFKYFKCYVSILENIVDEKFINSTYYINMIELLYSNYSDYSFNEEGLFLFGKLCLLRNDYKKGAEILRNLSLKGNVEASNVLGELYYLKFNDLQKAIDFYKMGEEAKNADEIFKLYIELGDYESASKYIPYLSKKKNVLFNLAEYYLNSDKYDIEMAIKILKKLLSCGYYKAAYQLACLYKEGTKLECDESKAIHYFNKYQNLLLSETTMLNKDKYFILGVHQLNSSCFWYNEKEGTLFLKKAFFYGEKYSTFELGKYYYSKSDLKRALNWYNKGYEINEINCINAIANIYCTDEFKKYDDALKLYLKIVKLSSKYCEDVYCFDPYKILPEIHYKIGYLYYNNEVIPTDLTKSLEYFKKAKSLGYNCDYSIEMVNSELGIENEDNFINKFARSIIYKQMNINNYPRIIEQEFSKDFSEEWNLLSKYSKDAIVVGMFNYLNCFSIEKGNQNLNIDYSSTINQFSKALEYETKNLFYSGYIKYLIEKNISPELFEDKKGFTQKKNGQLILKEQYGGYTLGSLKHVIGVKKQTVINTDSSKVRITEKYVIDDTMLDYCDKVLFKQEAFSQINRRKEITHYLIKLGNEVNDIVNFYRNPSAHCGKIMYRSKAETCGNWIIKGRKILKKLLEKVNTK